MLASVLSRFNPTSSVLVRNFEDKKYNKNSFEEKENDSLLIPHIEKLKNEQLVAGMVFRFFGLQNMPIYKADTAFLEDRNYFELPLPAKQLLVELQKNNDFEKNGSLHCNRVSKYKSDLAIDIPNGKILSFSITDGEKEIVIIYNSSKAEAYEKFIMLSLPFTQESTFLKTIYGYNPNVNIQVFNGVFNEIRRCYIRLYLKPMQMIILRSF